MRFLCVCVLFFYMNERLSPNLENHKSIYSFNRPHMKDCIGQTGTLQSIMKRLMFIMCETTHSPIAFNLAVCRWCCVCWCLLVSLYLFVWMNLCVLGLETHPLLPFRFNIYIYNIWRSRCAGFNGIKWFNSYSIHSQTNILVINDKSFERSGTSKANKQSERGRVVVDK